VFDLGSNDAIDAPHGRVTREGRWVTISGLTPGLGSAIEVRGNGGRHTQILLLSREQARNIWKASLGGRDRLIYSSADIYFEDDRVHLSSTDSAKLSFALYPVLEGEAAGFHRSGFHPSGSDGVFQSYTAAVEPVQIEADIRQVRAAGQAAPVKMGKEVAIAPDDAAFDGAARWSIHVSDVKSPAVAQVLLRIVYQGDVARIYAGGRLLTDDFYHGAPWEIGLQDIAAADLKKGLDLQILPMRGDAPIYLASEAKLSIPATGQIARLTGIRLLPVYHAVAALGQ
jgi:beta-galactosidase